MTPLEVVALAVAVAVIVVWLAACVWLDRQPRR